MSWSIFERLIVMHAKLEIFFGLFIFEFNLNGRQFEILYIKSMSRYIINRR